MDNPPVFAEFVRGPWFAAAVLTLIFPPALVYARRRAWTAERTPEAEAAVGRRLARGWAAYAGLVAATFGLSALARVLGLGGDWYYLAYMPTVLASGSLAPLLNGIEAVKNPASAGRLPAVRAASLAPRERIDVSPWYARGGLAVVAASGMVAAAAWLTAEDGRSGSAATAAWPVLIGGAMVAFFGLAPRLVAMEGQPGLPGESDALKRDRDEARRWRAEMLTAVGAGTGAAVAVSAAALTAAAAWGWLEPAELGLWGGLGGAALGVVGGLAGAVLGAMGTKKEQAWQDRLAEEARAA